MSINRETTITVKDIAFKVEYPNTGAQIDVELLKSRIANGSYDDLRLSKNPLLNHQADVIDAIATFTIIVPKIKEKLNVKSFFDLQEEEMAELLDIYTKQYLPWYIEVKKAIQNARKEKEEASRDELPKS